MWDERYAEEDYAYGTEPNDFLASMLDRLPVGRTLCLAEGQGRNAVFLASHGHQVTAVDASAVGLNRAQILATERGVTIDTQVADLAVFPIPSETWDTVVSIFAHVPPVLRRDLHARVVAGLKPGGVLLLEAYTPLQLNYNTGGPRVAELTMSLPLLREELAGLDFEVAVEREREIHEGKYHQGASHVVQVLARKAS